MFRSNNYRNGGTRGGQDQFKWEDVKTDKHRENYLGHSIHAPVGRWQKGKDLMWYARSKDKMSAAEIAAARESQLAAERAARKLADEEMLNLALGIKPKKRKFDDSKLEANDVKELLMRGSTERSDIDTERIQGLGAAPSKFHEHIKKMTLAERELARFNKEKEAALQRSCLADINCNTKTLESYQGMDTNQDQIDDEEKSRKKEKKMRKKLKKEKKKIKELKRQQKKLKELERHSK